jgi:hypothetical protein
MSDACFPRLGERPAARAGIPRDAAGWLALAAAPTFAAMALLTGMLGGGPMAMICSAVPGLPVDGMVLMYALMGVFHFGPWLTLASRGMTERAPPP